MTTTSNDGARTLGMIMPAGLDGRCRVRDDRGMVIDVHCHVGLSARPVDANMPRFRFEPRGAAGTPGFDSYLSPRLLRRIAWWFVRRWMGIDARLPRGPELDRAIETVNRRHWEATSADRLVLLAFDEYHDQAGQPVGMAEAGARFGSDLYASNTLVRGMCAAWPGKLLFGASIHPYRPNACDLLIEVADAGAVLCKWLPIHQNIDAGDSRTVDFLRAAGRLGMPMLIHYGGEMSLARQHMEFEHPGPLLEALRALRREGAMPPVIVAHAATPSFPWQSSAGCELLLSAMLGEFSDAPLYADISALAALGRTGWLKRLARRRDVHRKLVWGSDYPIPVIPALLWPAIDAGTRRRLRALPSWIEQDLQLKRALGFADCVFEQAAEVLRLPGTGAGHGASAVVSTNSPGPTNQTR